MKIWHLRSFCEFENIVNRAFLVLMFCGGNLVGANFYAFCNYEVGARERLPTVGFDYFLVSGLRL